LSNKKAKLKVYNFLKRRQRSVFKKQLRDARRRNQLKAYLRTEDYSHSILQVVEQRRAALRKRIYSRRYYIGPDQNVNLVGELGVEETKGVDSFLKLASELVDLKSRHLNFDFKNCSRIWPSAVMLFCSMVEWSELTSIRASRPRFSSSAPLESDVNSYLKHCGFFAFVKRERAGAEKDFTRFDIKRIVKIKREETADSLDKREDEIIDLMKKYSNLTEFQLEMFLDTVLIEVTRNVTEHGISNGDKGWFVLAQYHANHGIISVCIADNGIGIRHSLASGPQGEYLEKRFKNSSENDGNFVKLAITETVSGAGDAVTKESRFLGKNKFPIGSRRGHGLKRVLETCKDLKIPFSVLSHHGAVFISDTGEIERCLSMPNRVFAGTMYNFVVPAKQIKEG
jgi:hypothetical protein